MALEYFLYTTDYNNTLVDRSDTSFAPTPPYGEIHIDFLVPQTQPLYLYRENGGTIVLNDDATINAYLEGTAPAPQPDDVVPQIQFTGYTATTNTKLETVDNEIAYISGITDTKLNTSDFNSYSGATIADINSRVFRSGDTMTGTLCTTVNLLANGAVTGSSVAASVLMTTPVLNASTSVSAPVVNGSTCVSSPILCGTTSVISPVLNASTCLTTPTVCAGSCLCSVGTTRLNGGVTAASFLNVSGDTTLGNQLYLNNASTGGTLADYSVVWNPVTKQVRTIAPGGDACVYCYSDKRTTQSNSTTTNATYLTETWTLPDGCYEYEYSAMYGQGSSNRCATVCFLMNGAVVGYCNLMKTNDTNTVVSAYITQNNTLTAGSYTPSIVFRQQGGGTASVYYGGFRVQKIG